MARVFVTCRLFPDLLARLREAGHEVMARDARGPIPREELLRGVADAEALICLLSERVDAGVIGAGRSLRLVANLGVGYDNVDVAAARRAGVVVTNTPGALTEATADLTFALLLAAARRVVEGDRDVREGAFLGWELLQPHLGVDVHGATLGIVGMGRIGKAVARRARLGFDMPVIYFNRRPDPTAEAQLGVRRASFSTLLGESDFVSVHVPLTPETRHLFDREAFERMKRTAILVNVARGPVVDEEALVWALETGRIAGAALDVYEQEPAVHPRLLALRERVVLAPHIGSATVRTRRALGEMAVSNVLAVLSGRPALNPVA